MRRLISLLIGAVLLALAGVLSRPAAPSVAAPPAAALQNTDWGTITAGLDANGRWEVVLENSQIRVRYGYYQEGSAPPQTAMLDFILKQNRNGNPISIDQAGNQAGRYLDATTSTQRGLMVNAWVKYDGPDRKTVRLFWDNLDSVDVMVQDVSLYPDSRHLRIDYLKYGVNVVDKGMPGGQSTGTYEIYGNACWLDCAAPLGYLLYPESYYNRAEVRPSTGQPDPSNGGSLRYNAFNTSIGYFIASIYRPSSGIGYGRVMPVSAIDIIKLLQITSQGATVPHGFEWFPYYPKVHQSYTGYLFALNNAPAELAPYGQELADIDGQNKYTLRVPVVGQGMVTKSFDTQDYAYGTVVTLTATPAPGYSFANWSGGLSGTNNPAAVTLNGSRVVTATFTLNPYTLTTNVVGNGAVAASPDLPRYKSGQTVTLTATAGPGYTFAGWSGDVTGSANPVIVTMTADRNVTATFTQDVPPSPAPANWWAGGRRFRVAVQAGAAGTERYDKPAEAQLNFTTLLAALGRSGPLDLNSLRVVEVDALGAILDDAVPFQFDPDADFDAATKARGTLVFLLTGVTPADSTRTFHVYFDMVGNGPFTPLAIPAQVVATAGLTHDLEHTVRVQTRAGTYYYHTVGAAFTGLEDVEGIDWISYRPLGGASGEYRGVPNFSDDVAHPGGAGAATTIASQGPLKTVLSSTSKDGQWAFQWAIYPTYATLTVNQIGGGYWFLYEGTPYGQLNKNRDYFVLSDGVKRYVGDASVRTWNADIPNEEWVYFGDDVTPRVLFAAQHADDNLADTFWQMNNAMTVFGFGRSGNDPCTPCQPLLSQAPNRFTIGLVEDAAQAPQTLRSAYRDLTLAVGAPETVLVNQPPVLTPIGNKEVFNGSTLSFTLSATDGDGQTLTYSASGLPAGATLNPTTGAFSWTPTLAQVGAHPVTFSVSDSLEADSEIVTLTVGNRPPVLNPVGNRTVTLGQTLEFQLTASDADNNTLTYLTAGLPAGATLNPATGAFSWTPSAGQVGQHTVSFTVSDSLLTDGETIQITVVEVPVTGDNKIFLPVVTRGP